MFIVNSYQFASVAPASLLLDLYPATAAYSLRKLRTAYSGSAIRVRRSSDNAEQDIGFVGNDLDTASLLTFVGANDGFVTTWYDQQGITGAIQTVIVNQPRIVNSGVLELTNSLTACFFDNINDSLPIGAIGLSGSINRSVFAVVRPLIYGSFGGAYLGVDSSTGTGSVYDHCIENGFFTMRVAGNAQFSDVSENRVQRLWTSILSATHVFDVKIFKNGVSIARTGGTNVLINTNDLFSIGASLAQVDSRYGGYIQEIIIYANDQTANRTAIETNINDYYGIY